ncbi:hypothetical protein ACFPIB_09860 [Adhaeribacter terreus]|uniref:Outer membrane protein beta-barrel domain-containing protein n=1 Tax=Adhaeribacter terreus TaxID=529703 RepID=A0ABW0ECY0_9BACT
MGLLLTAGCTAPRSVIHSGKVTPKGEFKVGTNYAFNVATQPIGALSDVTLGLVNDLKNRDTVVLDDQVNGVSRAALAYTLDPVSPSWDFYVRYGLVERVDVGYKYAFGSHVFDAMYQFMGSTGTPKNPGKPGTYGSIGLQYSSRDSKLPGKVLWQNIDDLLQYNASRTDILVPLVFSTSFGPEEEIGNISYGVAYSHTWINYHFNPSNFVQKQADRQDVIPIRPLSAKNNYGAFGAFVNAKIGFKYAYILPALSIYYQNYGKYELLGGKQTELKGLTFIPSLGLQFQFGKGR